MQTSNNKDKASRRPGSPLPDWHRWLGGLTVVLVLLLSVTGIALNHAPALQLDRIYVDWPWLLRAYGVETPAITASYTSGQRRASLLNDRLYFEDKPVAEPVTALAGLVAQDGIFVAAASDSVLLLTAAGERIDFMDLSEQLDGPILAIGLVAGRAVLRTPGETWLADAALTRFERAAIDNTSEVRWAQPSVVDETLAAALKQDAIGRGLTLERVLIDLHSGRIAGPIGVWLMDIAALGLIFLSVSGLVLWRRRQKLAAQLGR